MQTVIETPAYLRKARALFTDKQRREVIDMIAASPEIGDIIPGTGGIRKVRVAASGRGKRGGGRVIYFVYDETIPILLLAAFAKNEKVDLDEVEKKTMRALVKDIKTEARKRRS